MSRWIGGDVKPNGNDHFTKVLLHFDGNFSDSNLGGSAKTWTTQRAATTVSFPTADGDPQFGSASGQFYCTYTAANNISRVSWIETPDSPEFTLGSSTDFTIEGWVKAQTSGGVIACDIAAQGAAASDFAWRLGLDGSSSPYQVKGFVSFNGVVAAVTVLAPTNWSAAVRHHIAFVRYGSTYQIFQDGVGGTPVTLAGSIHDSSAPLQIGAGSFQGNTSWTVDEFRFSVGKARWTTNFTPPTSAYSRFLGSGS